MNSKPINLIAIFFGFILAIHGVVCGQENRPQDESKRRIDDGARGILESSDAVSIVSPLKTVVLSIVPEGTFVKKGDLIISLDTSLVEDKLAVARIALNNQKAELIHAKSELEHIQVQSESGIVAEQLAVKVAELALRRFTAKGGEYDLEVLKVESRIEVAKSRIKVAKRVIELASDEIEILDSNVALLESQAELHTAEAQKKWLTEYVRIHEESKLERDLAEAKFSLDKVKREFQTRLLEAQAHLEAVKQTLDAERNQFERILDQMKKSQIRAPRDGLVVYPANRKLGTEPVEEGMVVRERQQILQVVNEKKLQLRANVHESKIRRIRIGQSADIHIDAFPNQVFKGKVQKVLQTPNRQNLRERGGMYYSVVVSIDESPPRLRIGMTALAKFDAKE